MATATAGNFESKKNPGKAGVSMNAGQA